MMKETLCRRGCFLKIPKDYTGFKAKTNVFAEHSRFRSRSITPIDHNARKWGLDVCAIANRTCLGWECSGKATRGRKVWLSVKFFE